MHITKKIYYLLPLPHPKDVGAFDVTSGGGLVGTTKVEDKEVGLGGGEDVGITVILNIIITLLSIVYYLLISVIAVGPYPSILLAFISIV